MVTSEDGSRQTAPRSDDTTEGRDATPHLEGRTDRTSQRDGVSLCLRGPEPGQSVSQGEWLVDVVVEELPANRELSQGGSQQ